MVRSKYLGKKYDNWTVTDVRIAGRYGKRKKAKGNSYCFVLTRPTHDDACMKSIVVSHGTMISLARGETTVPKIIKNQARRRSTQDFKNSAYYRFLRK